MPSIFRSENVEFCQIIIPDECAYNTMKAVGELDCMQFVDKNEEVIAFNRRYTKNIVWCEEMERKLRFYDEAIKKENLTAVENYDEEFIEAPDVKEFGELELEMETLMNQIMQSDDNLAELRKGYNELVEYRYVLRNTDKLDIPDIDPNNPLDKNVNTINGVIQRSMFTQFEQFLWRSCRGSVFLRQIPIEDLIQDAATGEGVQKCVFLIYLQGDQMVEKIKKACKAFEASIYDIPTSIEDKNQTSVDLMTRIKDMEMVLNQTHDQRRILFSQVCQNINEWRAKVLKIKAIYVTLNMLTCDTGSRALRGECWCPVVHMEKVRSILEEVQSSEQASVPTILNKVTTHLSPPTYYQGNKFTLGFQNLVDSYGVGTYKEINPALYMIISFPFLFAVMFGDFGHALVILSVGIILVVKEKAFEKYKNNELFGMVYSGRYIILLMGLFSMYTGFIYNDILSKSVYIWPSAWILPSHNTPLVTIDYVKQQAAISPTSLITLDPKYFSTPSPYPIGVDPIWSFSANKITFSNSFKMKTSIILGFSQMLFGIILSLVNHLYYGHKLEIFTEFIPQVIFFLAIFGYLVFMIFYKWIIFSSFSSSAPSILLALIGMFINFGKSIPSQEQLYSIQQYVEPTLVVIGVVCIPWMLLIKPIYLIVKKRQKVPSHVSIHDTPRSSTPLDSQHITENHNLVPLSDHTHSFEENESKNDQSGEEELGASEIAIMQLIHTIEFVLGTISNTASYLRLWALSLAHAQLSELLWNLLFRMSLSTKGYGGSVFIFLMFYAFLTFTLLILVIMEGLSAFLHAIRLHWVEFQSKFYSGNGSPLLIFSLRKAVQRTSD